MWSRFGIERQEKFFNIYITDQPSSVLFMMVLITNNISINQERTKSWRDNYNKLNTRRYVQLHDLKYASIFLQSMA